MSPSVAMATHYFPIFLIILFLSSATLLYLVTLAPSPSFPPSLLLPWPSPSCDVGQSWAVRLRTGPYYTEEGGEEVAVQLDVMANRVKHIINIFDLVLLQSFAVRLKFVISFAYSQPGMHQDCCPSDHLGVSCVLGTSTGFLDLAKIKKKTQINYCNEEFFLLVLRNLPCNIFIIIILLNSGSRTGWFAEPRTDWSA